MNDVDTDQYFGTIEFAEEIGRTRVLSYLSAIIAVGRQRLLLSAFQYLKKKQFDKKAIYEIILQSYLFLGFPRMIEAAIAFSETYGESSDTYEAEFKQVSPEESSGWFEGGINLCKQVYGKNYEQLKERFMSISPEMFRWMVIEGYGKVLTRPGLSSIERELAEVAALIVDRRERQLVSHIIGSLNVGTSISLVRQVNDDIRPLAGEKAYELATRLISKVESKYDSSY